MTMNRNTKYGMLVLLLAASFAAVSCGNRSRAAADFIDLELLADEDLTMDTLSSDDGTADSTAIDVEAFAQDSLNEEFIDAASAEEPAFDRTEAVSRIRSFVARRGEDGLYVFEEDGLSVEAGGNPRPYVLAALLDKDGLWAAVAPADKPDAMEKVLLDGDDVPESLLRRIDEICNLTF